MSQQPPDFTAGARHDLGHVRDGWTATVRVVPGAELVLPTGRLVACEPGPHGDDEADDLAFGQRVAPGRYRVELLVADIVDADGNAVDTANAAARLVVRDNPVATWTPAAQDDSGDVLGYPVDGGAGSFASPEALVALTGASGPSGAAPKLPPQALAALARVADELRDDDGSMDPARARGLRMLIAASNELSRLDLPSESGEVGVFTDRASGTNVVSFRSGDGDGCYPTWVGRTADGAVACFLTDFLVVTAPARV